MSTSNEIEKILDLFKNKKFYNFSILRCISNYPTSLENINLSSIETLRRLVNKKINNKKIDIGWSDHSKNQGVILKSIYKYDAEIIEFHLDLDGRGPEYKGGHCWLPSEIKKVIELSKLSNDVDGDGKIHYQKSEIDERQWRSDPKDGLRPMKNQRKKFLG